jgi:imidazole glycerol-phosphate synthase
MPTVHLLDYAAGNICSLVNAIEKLGWEVAWIKSPDDVANVEVSQFESTALRLHADG